VGAWVTGERKRLGMSREGLAARMGMSFNSVRNWETGGGLTYDTLLGLVRIFGSLPPELVEVARG
jgi:transcriptional regulator with XRE-family HTH domain